MAHTRWEWHCHTPEPAVVWEDAVLGTFSRGVSQTVKGPVCCEAEPGSPTTSALSSLQNGHPAAGRLGSCVWWSQVVPEHDSVDSS